jgi:hypothetical protein
MVTARYYQGAWENLPPPKIYSDCMDAEIWDHEGERASCKVEYVIEVHGPDAVNCRVKIVELPEGVFDQLKYDIIESIKSKEGVKEFENIYWN